MNRLMMGGDRSWISWKAIAAFFISGAVGTPLWLTWEDFLEKRGWRTMLDDTVVRATSGDYSFLADWLTSDFAIGAAVAAFAFGCWDVISGFRRRRSQMKERATLVDGPSQSRFLAEVKKNTSLSITLSDGSVERRRSFKGQPIDIAEHVTIPNFLDGLSYDDCTLSGPSVLMFDDACVLSNVEIIDVENREQAFLEIPSWLSYNGIVVAKGCLFRDCKFVSVVVADSAERLNDLRLRIKTSNQGDSVSAMIGDFLDRKHKRHTPPAWPAVADWRARRRAGLVGADD